MKGAHTCYKGTISRTKQDRGSFKIEHAGRGKRREFPSCVMLIGGRRVGAINGDLIDFGMAGAEAFQAVAIRIARGHVKVPAFNMGYPQGLQIVYGLMHHGPKFLGAPQALKLNS